MDGEKSQHSNDQRTTTKVVQSGQCATLEPLCCLLASELLRLGVNLMFTTALMLQSTEISTDWQLNRVGFGDHLANYKQWYLQRLIA